MIHSSIWSEFKRGVIKSDNTLYKIIALNVIIFIVINLLHVLLKLFNIHSDVNLLVTKWFALPANPLDALIKFWTFISYQFLHSHFNLFHIIFNMLILFWFGRIFVDYLGQKKLLSVFLLGGIAGGIFYLIAYQVFPYLSSQESDVRGMIGASASVMAVLVAIGTLMPDYSVRLLLFGLVKLKYIVLFIVVIDLLSLASLNAGGHFAHLGGAFFGFFYILQLKKGNDIGIIVGKPFRAIGNYLQSGKNRSNSNFKVHRKNNKASSPEPEQEEIDRILDKIAASGYDSLTKSERDTLFKASNK